MSEWTSSDQEQLHREYRRTGLDQVAWLPTPDPPLAPQAFLALLRDLPDGGGLKAYLEALRVRARRNA
jgi:hypothetical protein